MGTNCFRTDLAIELKREAAYHYLVNKLFNVSTVPELNATAAFDVALTNGYTIEIKVDDRALQTNNLAVEFQSKDRKPSGISTSQADYWLHLVLTKQDENRRTYEVYVFKTAELKELVKDNAMEKFCLTNPSIYLLPKLSVKDYKEAVVLVKHNQLEAVVLLNKEKHYF